MKYVLLTIFVLILALCQELQIDGVWDIFDIGLGILIFTALTIWATGADRAANHR